MRKRSRKTHDERRRAAEDSPTVRRLRELYAHGMDELEAKEQLRGRPRREYDSPAEQLQDLYAIGMEELAARRRAQQ